MVFKQLGELETTTLQREIYEAIKPILERRGVKLTRNNAKYRQTDLTLTLDLRLKNPESAQAASPAVQAANPQASRSLGFEENIVGKTFNSFDKEQRPITHTVTGFNMRNRKYPVLTMGDDGKGYKFPEKAVAQRLGVTLFGHHAR